MCWEVLECRYAKCSEDEVRELPCPLSLLKSSPKMGSECCKMDHSPESAKEQSKRGISLVAKVPQLVKEH